MSRVNATHFERIPTFPNPKDKNIVHAIIETPRNIRHKFALEPKYGILKLKQTIAQGLAWPYDYGFVPQTLADDGDPTDIVFLSDAPTFPGCLVEARILGIIRLKKNGVENDRIVACPLRMDGVAQNTDKYDDIKDIPKETLESLCRFLVEYSSDEDNTITFEGVRSRKKAKKSVGEGITAYRARRHAKKKG
ncbi:MAG TPA: inorganic diphosphatase [Candidatus Eremiobacteraceae bacterium]|nr:inorganic diphosphatase [Candidatus Eremiobacteraceae bacterium]